MKLFIFILVCMVVGAIASCTNTSKAGERQLTVGLQGGYPPFEFTDREGAVIGFDVDLAKILAEKLGKSLVIRDMEFDGLLLSLKQGKIDLIMSGMNITPSRLKEILMVPYHGEEPTCLSLVFWEKIPDGVHTLEDVARMPHGAISVESGTIPETYLSRYPAIPVKTFQGALAPLMDVAYGKSTATLVEPDVAEYLQRQHREVAILEVPLAADETILGFGIGINKDNPELFQQVSGIIQELKQSGTLKKLEDQWFREGGNG